MESIAGKSTFLRVYRCIAGFAGLVLMFAAPSVWAQCDVLTPIAPTAAVIGTLAPGDCTIQELTGDPDDPTFVDLFRVTLPVPGTLEILMTSNQFDTFLFLVDESVTQVIGFNDDIAFPSDINSRIVVPGLAAGTYIILANSALLPPETGSYTLSTTFTRAEGAVNGDWQGTWTSEFFGNSGSLVTSIVQSGNNLSGTMTVTNTPCGVLTFDSVTGDVSDTPDFGPNSVFLSAVTICLSNGASISISVFGGLSGNTISGNYEIEIIATGELLDAGQFDISRSDRIITATSEPS